jgi:hypothetical protein
MSAEKYSGYSNKPTCIIANWIKEDKDLQNYWRMRAEELTREYLIKELKLYIEDIYNPLTEKSTIYCDLLNYSIGLVNWDEIVDTLKEEDKQFQQ